MSLQSLKSALVRNRVACIAALVHWLLTFGLERLILESSASAHPFDYTLCKLLLLPLLFGFWHLLVRGVTRKGFERSVLLHALPYFAVLIAWLGLFHPFVLEADELNIFQRAVKLDSFAWWFNYPTGYYWIMGLMLLPHYMGPVFLKLLLQALVAGYCIARQKRLTGRNAWLLYLLFCLPFVLDLGISAHRLPTYGILYLFLIAKLLYDHLEHRTLNCRTLVLLSALIGLLAVWRTEGIYLVPLGPILIFVSYRVKPNKILWKQLLIYGLVLIAIAVPQFKCYLFDSDLSTSLRTKPLCGYALCNMFRNGLTEDMISDERADIEGYLRIETIHQYNEIYGDTNYSSALIMDGTENADYPTQERFCSAVKQVILKHPLIYAKSQWNAWRYTSNQYTADFSGGLDGIARGLTALTSKVCFPSMLVLLFCFLALIRRKWLLFWITGCGAANWVLVTALMPAAYAKYFYVNYLMGYFLLLVGLCFLLRRKGRTREHPSV